MKFSLEDISDVSSLVTELAPGLRELNLEDNVEGFLKKDLKFLPLEKKAIANEAKFIPTKFIVVNQIGNGVISRQYAIARTVDKDRFPTPKDWTQTQLFLVNTGREAVIVSIYFMR